jgi:hypothetical protein
LLEPLLSLFMKRSILSSFLFLYFLNFLTAIVRTVRQVSVKNAWMGILSGNRPSVRIGPDVDQDVDKDLESNDVVCTDDTMQYKLPTVQNSWKPPVHTLPNTTREAPNGHAVQLVSQSKMRCAAKLHCFGTWPSNSHSPNRIISQPWAATLNTFDVEIIVGISQYGLTIALARSQPATQAEAMNSELDFGRVLKAKSVGWVGG